MAANSTCDFGGGVAERRALGKYMWQGRVPSKEYTKIEIPHLGKCPLTLEEMSLMLADLGFSSKPTFYPASYKDTISKFPDSMKLTFISFCHFWSFCAAYEDFDSNLCTEILMRELHTSHHTSILSSKGERRRCSCSGSRRTINCILFLAFVGIFTLPSIWQIGDWTIDSTLDILWSSRTQIYSSILEHISKPSPLGENSISTTELLEKGEKTYNSNISILEYILKSSQSRENSTLRTQLLGKRTDELKYFPCLEFSRNYATGIKTITHSEIRYLIVVVNGGLNQQRNQIIDAVVISRILGTVLVVPVLHVNQVWMDKSKFSDIFNVTHFKETLEDDILITSSLPSDYIMSKPVELGNPPLNSSPEWFRSHFVPKLSKGKVFLLRSLNSRLSKNLPLDLQKLRCKVAFQALQFVAPIQELGTRLAQRLITQHGQYIALHLRLEKDVWVQTGCSPGLGPVVDEGIVNERIQKPHFVANNMTYSVRRRAGQCPLNAEEFSRFLSAIGANQRTVIYWAGGEPLGGSRALLPLIKKFPLLYKKETLASPGEVEEFKTKKSVLAAIDYLVCMNSYLFIPSHGGNMGRSIKGSRIYADRGRNLTPDKRLIFQVLDNTTLSAEEADQRIGEIHTHHVAPEMTTHKTDVLADPKLHCMCRVAP